ncbi:adenine phosphoribosyltransferase 1-like [Typha latifolia]|uniref:adenine phosphoribosyltransferase 1-like n=1 Tax=Typha latifolia TaxID=4733 RepID=UPI003C2C0080
MCNWGPPHSSQRRLGSPHLAQKQTVFGISDAMPLLTPTSLFYFQTLSHFHFQFKSASPLFSSPTRPPLIRSKPPRSFISVAAKVMDSAADDDRDHRLDRIASSIRVIPDFPKPGVMFQDITTLLLDPKAFRDTIDLFVDRYGDKGITVVAGIEARGFIFGPPIALAIGAKFVPMRKPNKLPGKVISEEYSLEYGTDIMEMHVGAVEPGDRVLVIDDLIATGGTLCAAIRLLERVGAEVVECACVIELPELKGREKLGDMPLFVLVKSV